MLSSYFDIRERRRSRSEDRLEAERTRSENRLEAERIRQEAERTRREAEQTRREERAEAERRHTEMMTALAGILAGQSNGRPAASNGAADNAERVAASPGRHRSCPRYIRGAGSRPLGRLGPTMPTPGDTTSVSLKLVETPTELEGAISVRMRVFVGEQGIPANVEVDDADTAPDTVHAVALRLGVVIATGRLLPDVDGNGPHIGRMAVLQEWRRTGVGGQVLDFLENQARRLGFGRITLHAQEYVKSFYAAHGYQEAGDMFLEVDIPHREMVKDL